MTTTVTGRLVRLMMETANEKEPVGLYLMERLGVVKWEKSVVPCPYCRRFLMKHKSGPRIVGRVMKVVKEDPTSPHALCDPVPKGYSILSCGLCKDTFTVPNWRLRKSKMPEAVDPVVGISTS